MGGGSMNIGGDPQQRMIADEEKQAAQMQAEEKTRNTKTQRDMISALRGGASGYGQGKDSLGG